MANVPQLGLESVICNVEAFHLHVLSIYNLCIICFTHCNNVGQYVVPGSDHSAAHFSRLVASHR